MHGRKTFDLRNVACGFLEIDLNGALAYDVIVELVLIQQPERCPASRVVEYWAALQVTVCSTARKSNLISEDCQTMNG